MRVSELHTEGIGMRVRGGDEVQCVTHRGDGAGDESVLHTVVMGLVVRVSVRMLKIPSTGGNTVVWTRGKYCKHQ